MSELLSPALVEELRHLDSCVISNAIETFNVRLRNQGFTNSDIHCMFDDLPPVVGHAVTATIRSSTPPPVGHVYADRTDWWNHILTVPAPGSSWSRIWTSVLASGRFSAKCMRTSFVRWAAWRT